MKKAKRLISTNWKLQNSLGDVKQSIGNIVNNIEISTRGGRQVLEISRGTLCKACDCLRTMLET